MNIVHFYVCHYVVMYILCGDVSWTAEYAIFIFIIPQIVKSICFLNITSINIDSLLILQYSVDRNVTFNLESADVDGSDTVDIMDALLILLSHSFATCRLMVL